jgi:hypothetical protein
MHGVNGAIEEVSAQRLLENSPDKAVLWDLFALDPHNGGWEKRSDRGAVLRRLDAKTLRKLRDWLDENKERAVEHYGYGKWGLLRAEAGVGACLKPLPADTQLLPDTEDDLPLRVVAVRTDGKKWDLNVPIRAELLRLRRRYRSERDMARRLAMPKTSYRDLRSRMRRLGFTLERFSADDLWAAVHGNKRGRRSQSEADKEH